MNQPRYMLQEEDLKVIDRMVDSVVKTKNTFVSSPETRAVIGMLANLRAQVVQPERDYTEPVELNPDRHPFWSRHGFSVPCQCRECARGRGFINDPVPVWGPRIGDLCDQVESGRGEILRLKNEVGVLTAETIRRHNRIQALDEYSEDLRKKVVDLMSQTGKQRGEIDTLTIRNRDLSRLASEQAVEIADLKEHARGYRVELNRQAELLGRRGFQLQDAEDAKKFRRLKAILEEA